MCCIILQTSCTEEDSRPYFINISFNKPSLFSGFSPSVHEYTVDVDYDTDSLELSIETIDGGIDDVRISVNGQEQNSPVILLEPNQNIVVVTSNRESNSSYTFVITRGRSPYVSGITVSSLTPGFNELLNPSFDSRVPIIVYAFLRKVSKVTIDVTMEDPSASYIIKAANDSLISGKVVSLLIGDNILSIETVSSDGTLEKKYEVHIVRTPKGDALLKKLSFSTGTLVPDFDPEIFEYELVLSPEEKNVSFETEQDEFSEVETRLANTNLSSRNFTSSVLPQNLIVNVVSDNRLETNQYKVSVARQGWRFLGNGPFDPKDGAGILEFKGKLWLLGGWENGPAVSEVWSSTDGTQWNFVSNAPWEGRHCAGYVVFKDRMWIVSGDGIPDVWSSADGYTWTVENASAPWGRRYSPIVVVYDDKIWLMGGLGLWDDEGEYLIPKGIPAVPYNDVWCSPDGKNWTRVLDHAPWEPRALIHGNTVFQGKMWIIGGGTKGTNDPIYEYNDVWNSTDGIHWNRVMASGPWRPRTHMSVTTFDNKLWLTDGSIKVQTGLSNEVWYSEDGIIWNELKRSPWNGTHASSLIGFNNKLFLICGYIRNEIWMLDLE